MKRREFIKISAILSAMILLPIDVKAKKNNKKTLILVELNGGNDALNSVIPFNESNYYNLRPSLALKKDEINIIEKDFGLNKNLSNITKLYKSGSAAIVHGLGYDSPNLSHFRSIEIVETASQSKEYLKNGWISSELRKYDLNEKRPANAMLIGKSKKAYLFSNDLSVLKIKSIEEFIRSSSNINDNKIDYNINRSLNFLNKQEDILVKANKAISKYASNVDIKTIFNQTDISNDFKEALKVIKSDLDIPLIKISQKGYDTHANQMSKHNILLKEFDDAIGSFVNELKEEDLYKDVLIVTYSEFGRRVKENGSLGTDHGTASSHFVLGGEVKGGMYGKAPSLNNLDKNNLIYTTHYRTYYNTILTKWFGNKNNQFNSYDILNFL
ncbi:MAG: DUF1501 domain-containing protein [Arcobacter sp.]|nr:DUF1501 domain-containing protein [Arcobacter sp.]